MENLEQASGEIYAQVRRQTFLVQFFFQNSRSTEIIGHKILIQTL